MKETGYIMFELLSGIAFRPVINLYDQDTFAKKHYGPLSRFHLEYVL